jgi:hypothetical protein
MAGDHAYASLARLNVVSHAIHEETLAVMYETVVWNTTTRCGFAIKATFRRGGNTIGEYHPSVDKDY